MHTHAKRPSQSGLSFRRLRAFFCSRENSQDIFAFGGTGFYKSNHAEELGECSEILFHLRFVPDEICKNWSQFLILGSKPATL